MQTISVTNLKGGAGKTSSVVGIADALTQEGVDVLVVDLDPQGTASAWMGRRSDACRHLLTTGFDPSEHVVSTKEESGRLDLITANRSLERAEDRRASDLASRLERLWKGSEGSYDIAILDTPPQAGTLVTAALLSTAAALVPVAPGRGPVDGLKHVMEYTKRIGGASIRAAFACNVDVRSKLHKTLPRQLIEQLEALDREGKAARHYVRSTVRVQEAEAKGELLSSFAPSSTAWADYKALTAELGPVSDVRRDGVGESMCVTREDMKQFRASSS